MLHALEPALAANEKVQYSAVSSLYASSSLAGKRVDTCENKEGKENHGAQSV